MFDPSTYLQRRTALLSRGPQTGLIAIFGNEESPMNYTDNVYPFRQDSNFLYFTGIQEAHHFLLIDPENGTSTLCGDDLSLDHIVWMGAQPLMEEKAASAGINRHLSYQEGLDTIARAAKVGKKIHYLPPYRADRVELLAHVLQQPAAQTRTGFSELLTKTVITLREIKTEAEIVEMEKAVNTTAEMHIAAMKAIQAGQTEAYIAGIVEGIAVGGGGRLAYPCISTINGHILHNHYHGNRLKDGQLLLLDAGAAAISNYAADITRTFPVSANFTAQQAEIYQIVLDAEEQSIAALKAGVSYLDIHLQAARIITNGLKALGLMKGDTNEAVAQGAHALFFPHGLGHMIGLDVHDMEDLVEDWVGYDHDTQRSKLFGLKSLRLAKKLQAGHVLTVEPGIYFIPALIDRWQEEGRFLDFINYDKLKSYRQFGGIRIEDNILITEKDHRVLGDLIPKTIEEIEQLQ
ncbi:MAG: aminopeptidase P family protein [Bacteroidota bacterium]